ncbi:MAG: sel1 repeat family protein [Gammaproteobacteria bacterium]|nr:sel1 repeat family protein [Gammaproteobacteria bacterium]MBP9728660.1 sel1 repeat family protein [Gammaproteobacteria bacterium]
MTKRRAPELAVETHTIQIRSQASEERKPKRIKTASDQTSPQKDQTLLFSARSHHVDQTLREKPSLATKRVEFFNYLKDVIGNDDTLDYEIAQTADLLAQEAYKTPCHSSIQHNYGRAKRFYNDVINNTKTNAEKSKAAYELAKFYRDGNAHLPQHQEQSIAWYTIAGLLGSVEAQFELAQIYEASAQEYGLPEDFTQAINWYQKAVDQSHADAQEALSKLWLLSANAVIKDIEKVEAQVKRLIDRLIKTRRFSEADKHSVCPQ